MLYGVVGEGTGNKTEIVHTLEDLREKAAADEVDFWFVIIAKDEPTTLDGVILKWLHDAEVWYEVIGTEDEDTYPGAQAFHGAKDPMRKMLALLTEKNAEEGAILLASYVDSDAEVEEDAELATLVERVVEEGIEVRLLNEQMILLTFGEDDETPEDDEPEAEDEPLSFTKAELTPMRLPELQAIAKAQGIDVKVGGKAVPKPALIEAILAKISGEPEDEPAPAPRASKAAARKAAAASTAGDEDAPAGAVALLDAPSEARQAASVIVVVDGIVTVIPVSVGHARSILNGR